MKGNITITKEEYTELRKAKLKLDRLERGGVDNWDWYWESLNPEEGLDLDNAYDELEKEIERM